MTEWNKVSDGAKRVLFSPQHADNINDIVGMEEHTKKALANSNTSHTAAPLILLDAAQTPSSSVQTSHRGGFPPAR